ncbi:MAG: hypothetical protein JRJ25_07890 [Deltaproteobacteria bacterium]|nr:hypothetical protein [Deltaproteobacteria bacterium]
MAVTIVVSCVKYRTRHSSFPRRLESRSTEAVRNICPRLDRGMDSRLRGNDGYICDTT